MAWAAVGAAAITAVGSYASASAAPGAPAPPKPGNVYNPLLGNATYVKRGNGKNSPWDLTQTPNAAMTQMGQGNIGQYGQYMSGDTPTGGFQQWAQNSLQPTIPGQYQDSIYSSAIDTNPYARYDAQSGFLGDSSGMGGTYAMQHGMNLLGNNYQGVADQRLALLRQQAAPFEQQAYNANNQNLFATGRMGTTGGGLQTEAFARGLGQADLARQTAAQGQADQLYQFDQGAGQNMMNTAGYLNTGANSIFNGQFGAQVDYNALVNARSQQRLKDATSLFGFGNELAGVDQGRAGTAQQNYLNLSQALTNQSSASRGGQQTAPVQSQGSPGMAAAGGFLQGIGGAIPGMVGSYQTGQANNNAALANFDALNATKNTQPITSGYSSGG